MASTPDRPTDRRGVPRATKRGGITRGCVDCRVQPGKFNHSVPFQQILCRDILAEAPDRRIAGQATPDSFCCTGAPQLSPPLPSSPPSPVLRAPFSLRSTSPHAAALVATARAKGTVEPTHTRQHQYHLLVSTPPQRHNPQLKKGTGTLSEWGGRGDTSFFFLQSSTPTDFT